MSDKTGDKPTIEIRLPVLHKGQLEVFRSKARFRVVCCGRKWGKTTLSIQEVVIEVLRGGTVGYFAPSMRTMAEVWRLLVQILQPVIQEFLKDEYYLRVMGGGEVEFWSLGVNVGELARSRSYSLVVVDEAAIVRGLMDYWNYLLRPLLMAKGGRALFLSTPRSSDFRELCEYGGIVPGWEVWQAPTSANPHISADELEQMRLTLPDRVWRQEILAEHLDSGGAVFSNIGEVCTGEVVYGGPGLHVMGVDWGRVHDATVISVMEVHERRQVYIERLVGVPWAAQVARVTAICNDFRAILLKVEENSVGQVMLETLQGEGLPIVGFLATNKSKMQIIDALAWAMERKQVVLLKDAQLMRELRAFSVEDIGVTWRYGAVAGEHDDMVMATAINFSLINRWYSDVRSLVDFV